MQVDETLLSQKTELIKLSITGSSHISNRTAAVIAKLESPSGDGKAVIVALTAKSRAANKMVSIVEIAKRELASRDVKCFQYNALTAEMADIERISKEAANGTDQSVSRPNAGSDSEDAFETMGAHNGSGLKKRLLPVMTTYLCNTSVKELKNAYG